MHQNGLQTVLKLEDSIVPFVKIWFLDVVCEGLVARFVFLPKVSTRCVDHRTLRGKEEQYDQIGSITVPMVRSDRPSTLVTVTVGSLSIHKCRTFLR